MKWKSVFNFFHLCTQLYKYPLFQQIEVLILSYIIIMYTWICFGFSLLFNLSIWLFLCQYYTDFIVSALSCLTFCNSMYCSLLGSSVHGISEARILEWVTISFARGFHPESKPVSPTSPALQADSLPLSLLGSPYWFCQCSLII